MSNQSEEKSLEKLLDIFILQVQQKSTVMAHIDLEKHQLLVGVRLKYLISKIGKVFEIFPLIQKFYINCITDLCHVIVLIAEKT